MIVIYHCYGGTHSSVLAAAVHTGYLAPGGLPSKEEIEELPHFDGRDGKDIGKLCHYGRDENGNEVYIVGRKSFSETPEFVFRSLQKLYGSDKAYKLVNSARTLNWQMKLGGYISRGLGIKHVGLPIELWGARKAYPRVESLVERIKKEV
ncbi:MAG: DUF3189 family protein [Clostridia bacterium]|nr:DUF3189 family protein [Clostridia bacterium]MDQ7791767.1 DUF3189 family protein [Clostridia bacterium]